jgi:hypothetical protein
MDATGTASTPRESEPPTHERAPTGPAVVAVSVWLVVAIVLVLGERLVA